MYLYGGYHLGGATNKKLFLNPPLNLNLTSAVGGKFPPPITGFHSVTG